MHCLWSTLSVNPNESNKKDSIEKPVPPSEDEDDDDEKDDALRYVDFIGDIEQKLKNQEKHKLKYVQMKQSKDKDITRDFGELLKELGGNDDSYIRNKRLISIIDRRESKDDDNIKDTIFMYQPPIGKINSMKIPTDAVSEWGIGASRACLLPSMFYDPNKEPARELMHEKMRTLQDHHR